MTDPIEAIYENGVFRPVGPVNLPERARVRVEPTRPEPWERQECGAEPGYDPMAEPFTRPGGHFPIPWTEEDDRIIGGLPPERRASAIRLRRLAGCLADVLTDEDDQFLEQIIAERHNETWRELPE